MGRGHQIGIGIAFKKTKPNEGVPMNFMLKELASVNLFVIWLVILGGFAFLRVVKRRLED